MGEWVGKPVLFPWFEEHLGAVHPDDVDITRELRPYGKLFFVEAIDDGWLCLRYGETVLRGSPSVAKAVATSVWRVGAAVQLADGCPAVVLAVNWHHGKSEPFYQVSVEGKKKSKRYWLKDLAGTPPS